jgi:hypothetical protein
LEKCAQASANPTGGRSVLYLGSPPRPYFLSNGMDPAFFLTTSI